MVDVVDVMVLVIVTTAAIGPARVPAAALSAGRFLGRAVRFLRDSRTRFRAFAEEHRLPEVHAELSKGLDEVNTIRSEWQQVSRLRTLPNVLYENRDPLVALTSSASTSSSRASAPGAPTITSLKGADVGGLAHVHMGQGSQYVLASVELELALQHALQTSVMRESTQNKEMSKVSATDASTRPPSGNVNDASR